MLGAHDGILFSRFALAENQCSQIVSRHQFLEGLLGNFALWEIIVDVLFNQTKNGKDLVARICCFAIPRMYEHSLEVQFSFSLRGLSETLKIFASIHTAAVTGAILPCSSVQIWSPNL